jgi:hypothetical protein
MEKIHGMHNTEDTRSIDDIESHELEDELMFTKWKIALERELPVFWNSMMKK